METIVVSGKYPTSIIAPIGWIVVVIRICRSSSSATRSVTTPLDGSHISRVVTPLLTVKWIHGSVVHSVVVALIVVMHVTIVSDIMILHVC